MVQWKWKSGTQTRPAPETPPFPCPEPLLSGGSQRPLPDALHLGRPVPERINRSASPGSGTLGFLPPPASAFLQPPGQGIAHLAAFSCLPVTHLVLTGSPSQAGTFLALLGVSLVFVGALWRAALVLSGGTWTGLAEPPGFLRAEFLQSP